MGEENPRKKRWWKKRRHPNPNSLQQPDGAMRAASTSEPEVRNITSQLLHFCENIVAAVAPPSASWNSQKTWVSSQVMGQCLQEPFFWGRSTISESYIFGYQLQRTGSPTRPGKCNSDRRRTRFVQYFLLQAPSPLYTALAPEGNPDQASGAVEVGLSNILWNFTQTHHYDPKGRIANAYEATAGMNSFTGIVQNTASATDGIQSGLDTIGNFSSIIEPLKVFNSIVNGIANVLALIFTLYMVDPSCTDPSLCSGSNEYLHLRV